MASTTVKVIAGTGCGLLLLIGGSLATCAGCVAMINSSMHATPETSATSPRPPSDPLPYTVVKQWNIPAGGRGRVVVIDKSHSNEADLRRLGEQLRVETPHGDYEFDEVYDSVKATSMRDAAFAEHLGKKRLAFHDRHVVMFYIRNPTTRLEELSLFPQGLNGHLTKINF